MTEKFLLMILMKKGLKLKASKMSLLSEQFEESMFDNGFFEEAILIMSFLREKF